MFRFFKRKKMASAAALFLGSAFTMDATNGPTNDFRRALMEAGHNFKVAGLTYKILLIKVGPGGTYDQTLSNVGTPGSGTPTTSNVGTDEVSGTGYTTGGVTLATNVAPAVSSNVATTSWSTNPSWTTATFSATSAVVFTNDAGTGTAGRTVGNYDFGGTQTVTSGTFTIVLPSNTSTLAAIRIT